MVASHRRRRSARGIGGDAPWLCNAPPAYRADFASVDRLGEGVDAKHSGRVVRVKIACVRGGANPACQGIGEETIMAGSFHLYRSEPPNFQPSE